MENSQLFVLVFLWFGFRIFLVVGGYITLLVWSLIFNNVLS